MRTASTLLLASLAALGTGCHGAAWDKTELPPPATPPTGAAAWTQYCTYDGATDLTEINAWLQTLGRQGWQLVSVGGNTATVYCFKAPLPGRPSAVDSTAPDGRLTRCHPDG